MTYSHRNGEATPPTVEGFYWFDGKHIEQSDTSPDLKSFLWMNAAQIVRYKRPERKTGTTPIVARMLVGRWWGPVTPPWEAS